MKSLESLKDLLCDTLLKNDGDIKLSEHRDIINHAKELGFDDRKLSKLLQEVDATINWDYIQQQKELSNEVEEGSKKPPEKKKKTKAKTKEVLLVLIDKCTNDKLFSVKDIKRFFELSAELKINENESAKLLRDYFSKNRFTATKVPVGTSSRALLESTDWRVEFIPQPQLILPQKTKTISPLKIFIVIGMAFMGIAIIGECSRSDKTTDKKAITMYSYTNSLAFRSTPEINGYNVQENLRYGAELNVSKTKGDWAKCTIGNKEGYVSLQYLLNKKEFYELEGIIGDNNAKEIVSTARCRKALLNYFSSKGIMGQITLEMQKEIYGVERRGEKWQVFAKPKDSRYNTVAYLKIVNPYSKFEDFACIIENLSTQQRRFLLFTFDDTESPSLEFEEEAPRKGNIKAVRRLYKQNQPVYKVTYIN